MTIGSSFVRLVVGIAATVALISLAAPATPGGTLQPMKESGEGAFEKASGCDGNVDQCTKFTADAHGRPIDDGALVLKFGGDVSQNFYNPYNKQCYDTVGEGTFRKGANKILFSFEGPFCEGGGPRYLKLYYKITGGDGRFDLAKGRGGMLITGFGDISYRSDGTLKL